MHTNNMTNIGTRVMTQLRKLLWLTLTAIGNRRLVAVVRRLVPVYRDTIFYFQPTMVNGKRLVALTIDDGLSRGGIETSMVKNVVDILAKYNATATFFVCLEYCIGDEEMKQATRDLVHVHGHELGNHMSIDVSRYYSRLNEQDFCNEFEACNRALQDLVNDDDDDDMSHLPYRIRWYRAPQGIYTRAMKQVLDNRGSVSTRHVLGDCYCDDWALACRDSAFVYKTTMRQVREGSILITHMPEKNTNREAILNVLERLLCDLDSQGYRCVSLGEMWDICNEQHAHSDGA
jgi:peptidoglycan/xylan/chitin deacetylase (PgdA/CDA1 family)